MKKCPHCDKEGYHIKNCRIVHLRDTLHWKNKTNPIKEVVDEDLWSYPCKEDND